MPTNITYKGSILTTVNNNQAKILKTSGKYLEDDITVSSALNLQGKTTSITPNTSTQTTTISPDSGYEGLSGVTITVNPIPSQYIIPAGTITITSNGTHDVSQYADAEVQVSTVNNQNKTVVPSETTQTVTADTGYTGLGTVTVNGITNTYVGSGVTRRDESDISQEYVSPEEVISIPQGYYADDVSYALPSGSFSVSSITVSASGQVTAQANTSEEGYIKRGVGTANVYQLTTQSATTVIPSETAQTLSVNQKYMTGDVTVAAITPTYVGSSVPAGEMLVDGPTVTATAGYYATALTETIDDAELNGNIVFSKQPVSIAVDNAGLITATSELVRDNMIINQAGGYIGYHTQEEYIISNGSTTYQLPVQAATTVVPSEITTTVTGQKYMTGDITVAAITSTYVGSEITTNPTITVSGPTVTIPSGYYNSENTKTISNAVIADTITIPMTSANTFSVDENGLVSATRNYMAQTNAAVKSSGYITTRDFIRIEIPKSTSTYQLHTQAATTITPSSATQTITGQKYMTGDITVQPIPSQYIVPSGTLTITSVDTTTTFDAINYASVAVNLKNADVTAF